MNTKKLRLKYSCVTALLHSNTSTQITAEQKSECFSLPEKFTFLWALTIKICKSLCNSKPTNITSHHVAQVYALKADFLWNLKYIHVIFPSDKSLLDMANVFLLRLFRGTIGDASIIAALRWYLEIKTVSGSISLKIGCSEAGFTLYDIRPDLCCRRHKYNCCKVESLVEISGFRTYNVKEFERRAFARKCFVLGIDLLLL